MDRRPGLLGLAYNRAIPDATLAAMERLGKRLGLPLATLEMLGQDPGTCEAFVRAGVQGALRFVRSLDLGPRQGLRRDRLPLSA